MKVLPRIIVCKGQESISSDAGLEKKEKKFYPMLRIEP